MTPTNKMILGILGAAAAGVIIGMFVAPESGTDLRKKIKDNAGNWANKLADLLSRAKENGTSLEQENYENTSAAMG